MIDWTKPLETIEGTPVKLVGGKLQPDGDGDYHVTGGRNNGGYYTADGKYIAYEHLGVQIRNRQPVIVDWSQPIEAVRKADRFVFPVTVRCRTGSNGYATMECPDPDTTNTSWREDGSDLCSQDKWFIRNRQPAAVETVTVPRLTEADVKEARTAFNYDQSGVDRATFYAKRWGLLREETPAEKFTRETGIAVTADIEAALAWAVSK